MTLISALFGLVIDRLIGGLHEYRRYDQFFAYVDWMRKRLDTPMWDGIAGLLLVLTPLLLLVGVLQSWTSGLLFGLIGLAFYILVFVYCLGPRDLAADVDTWCEVGGSSDRDLRRRAAARLLAEGEEVPDDPQACTARVTRSVLTGANERLFAVLFWFIVLGPLGAVLYRAAALLYRRPGECGGFADAAALLHAILVWLPARLTALGYALSGHFDSALAGWRAAHGEYPEGTEGSERVLAETGLGALALSQADSEDPVGDPVRAAMRLVWRTLVVWLVGLSLMTLAGWAS